MLLAPCKHVRHVSVIIIVRPLKKLITEIKRARLAVVHIALQVSEYQIMQNNRSTAPCLALM